jgi:mannose-6-phosphate isomerase-like protein (cupin superfamily)
MKFKKSVSKIKKKVGINLSVYNVPKITNANIVHITVAKGHSEEFYHERSTFIYYIIKGKGKFYLNSKENKVKLRDLLVIPPKTRIYYQGRMELLLITIPPWEAKYEHHVRYLKFK